MRNHVWLYSVNSLAISIVFILSTSSGCTWTTIQWFRRLLIVELRRYVLIPENALSLEAFVAGMTRKSLASFTTSGNNIFWDLFLPNINRISTSVSIEQLGLSWNKLANCSNWTSKLVGFRSFLNTSQTTFKCCELSFPLIAFKKYLGYSCKSGKLSAEISFRFLELHYHKLQIMCCDINLLVFRRNDEKQIHQSVWAFSVFEVA